MIHSGSFIMNQRKIRGTSGSDPVWFKFVIIVTCECGCGNALGRVRLSVCLFVL